MTGWLTRSRQRWHALLEKALLRLPRHEPLPLELGQRRIYVLPTASGYGLLGTLLVMLTASINYDLALGYALTFLLGGAGVASIIHAFRNLQALRIGGGRAEPAFLGGTAVIELVLHNDRLQPRPAITVIGSDSATTLDVPAQHSAVARLNSLPQQRGWHHPGRLVVETRFPLGFIRAWSVLHPDLRVLIYPRPEARPPALPGAEGGAPASQHSPLLGEDDFAGLRTHQPADPPRHVAWKVVARGGPLLVKQFASDSGDELELDWAQLPPMLGTEQRLSRLTAWLQMAERSGRNYTLRLPTTALGPASGQAHLHACLTRLALFGDPSDGR